MCWYVIVAYRADSRAVARGLLRSAHHLRETTNPSVLGALPPGWTAGYLMDEMCGCDMYADPRRVEGGDERTLRGIRRDVRRAIGELARTAGEARTLVHWFLGAVDEEAIHADKEAISIERFIAEDEAVVPDVWYAVRAREHKS